MYFRYPRIHSSTKFLIMSTVFFCSSKCSLIVIKKILPMVAMANKRTKPVEGGSLQGFIQAVVWSLFGGWMVLALGATCGRDLLGSLWHVGHFVEDLFGRRGGVFVLVFLLVYPLGAFLRLLLVGLRVSFVY
jgi:hypothetical protein